MTEPTLDTLAQRLDRMESAVRRLVGALLALAMLVGIAMDALYRSSALQVWDRLIGLVAAAIFMGFCLSAYPSRGR